MRVLCVWRCRMPVDLPAWPCFQAPRAFSAAGDGYAYAWDLSTGKCTAKFKGALVCCAAALGLRLTMLTRLVAIGGHRTGHTDCVNSIIFMDTHNAIATASRDGSVRVWGPSPPCRTCRAHAGHARVVGA